MERMDRRIVAIERDLSHAQHAGELTAEAQLLLACAHGLEGASGVVQLEDPATGTMRSIDLEGRTPFDAAERRFEEARRRRSGEKVARARSDEAVDAKAELERLALRIEDDDVPLDVLALQVRAAVRPAQAPVKGPKGEVRTRLPYREIVASGARVVLVGKTSADNDELTTKVARAHDLWLHARGMPGSHVVVPLEKGESIDPQLLIDAATLAAHFSDARGEEKVEVSYVERRHVRKKRGSPPGSVQVERDKTMLVRIEPDRLARLLSGKR
jgi:predicted ribosome quality control (RQC) complex YloA/Tae2 family protein